MSTYWEKLKDPRWQRKRLEIFERAGFACEQCGAKDQQLHCHHKIYHKGHEPWEYQDRELACLCDGCHEHWHLIKDFISGLFVTLDEGAMRSMAGYGIAMAMDRGVLEECQVGSPYAVEGFARYFGVSTDDVLRIRGSEMWISSADATRLKKKAKRTKR